MLIESTSMELESVGFALHQVLWEICEETYFHREAGQTVDMLTLLREGELGSLSDLFEIDDTEIRVKTSFMIEDMNAYFYTSNDINHDMVQIFHRISWVDEDELTHQISDLKSIIFRKGAIVSKWTIEPYGNDKKTYGFAIGGGISVYELADNVNDNLFAFTTNIGMFSFEKMENVSEYAAKFIDGYMVFTPEDASNNIAFNSDCTLDSPTVLTIFGPCVNPSWIHKVNGKVLVTGSVRVVVDEDEYVKISCLNGVETIKLYGPGRENGTNIFGRSDYTKKRFIYVKSGRNQIIVRTCSGYPKFKIEGREYYATV